MMTTRTFGIEIEMIAPATMMQVAAKIREAGVECYAEGYNHNTRRFWKIVTDGSVQPNQAQRGMCAMELVSPVLSGTEGMAEVAAICTILAEIGCQVNKTCGLHIHQGANDLDARAIRNVVAVYAKHEAEIDAMMAPSRRGSVNTFCKSVIGVNDYALQNDRYHKVNLGSMLRHGTVEFRQHAGTIDAEKILNWVRLTQRMVEVAKMARKTFKANTTNAKVNTLSRSLKIQKDLVLDSTEELEAFAMTRYIAERKATLRKAVAA